MRKKIVKALLLIPLLLAMLAFAGCGNDDENIATNPYKTIDGKWRLMKIGQEVYSGEDKTMVFHQDKSATVSGMNYTYSFKEWYAVENELHCVLMLESTADNNLYDKDYECCVKTDIMTLKPYGLISIANRTETYQRIH